MDQGLKALLIDMPFLFQPGKISLDGVYKLRHFKEVKGTSRPVMHMIDIVLQHGWTVTSLASLLASPQRK